jgi:hypothetical protein
MSKAEFKDSGLVGELGVQCLEPEKLEQVIQANLRGLGYGG